MHRPARLLPPLLFALFPGTVPAADKSAGEPVLTKPQNFQTPALQKPAQPLTKDKTDNTHAPQALQNMPPATGEARKKRKQDAPDKHTTPQNLPVPPGPGTPAAGPSLVLPEKTRKQLQTPRQHDLPQLHKPSLGPAADTVHIRLSGVAPYGGSAVGGDDGEALAVSRPGVIVMVRHGELWMHGVVPGERDTYNYYLVVQPRSQGPGNCRVASPAGTLTDVTADKPDVQGDGRVRLIGRGWDRQIRNVSVPQDSSVVQYYYFLLCVVGVHPETRESVSIASNLAQLAVLPD